MNEILQGLKFQAWCVGKYRSHTVKTLFPKFTASCAPESMGEHYSSVYLQTAAQYRIDTSNKI